MARSDRCGEQARQAYADTSTAHIHRSMLSWTGMLHPINDSYKDIGVVLLGIVAVPFEFDMGSRLGGEGLRPQPGQLLSGPGGILGTVLGLGRNNQVLVRKGARIRMQGKPNTILGDLGKEERTLRHNTCSRIRQLAETKRCHPTLHPH